MRGIYLLTGANLGDREVALRRALNQLEKNCGKIVALSPLFETAAWGKHDQPPFLNQAIELDSQLTPRRLMENILLIEEQMGRQRLERYGARLIDIDIIFFSGSVIQQENLCVPHPQMQNRKFVLAPLKEIAPDFIHPVFNKTVSKLYEECTDELPVLPYSKAD